MIALLQAGYYAEPHAARYDAATMGMFVLIIAIGVIGFIVQARLHDEPDDADGDDQDEHAHRRGVVARGVRLCIVTCLEQGNHRKCHSVVCFVFRCV